MKEPTDQSVGRPHPTPVFFIDSFGNFVASGYGDNSTLFIVFVAVPALVAQYALAVWLLIKGGRSGQQTTPGPAAA